MVSGGFTATIDLFVAKTRNMSLKQVTMWTRFYKKQIKVISNRITRSITLQEMISIIHNNNKLNCG